jgi:hypothetical protein
MIKFYNSLQVAHTVLSAVNSLLREGEDEHFWVETYSNCREQGYCIVGNYHKAGSKTIAFSENRNSDSIVVYCDENREFSLAGNVPNDSVYRNSRMFGFGKYQEAAEYIVAMMREAIKNTEKLQRELQTKN